MSVLLAKRALPRSLGAAPPPEVAAALARLPDAFGQLGLSSETASLNIKALKGQPGLYRLRVGDWRAVFLRTGDGFLVAAVGLRKDIYERVARMRLARKGEGVRIIELSAPEERRSHARDRAVAHERARAPEAVVQNPLSAFSDAELVRIDGVDDSLVTWLRALPESIDIGAALAGHVADADLALLLADLWERPAHHIPRFSDGEAPSVDDMVLELDELSRRLSTAESETEVVATETEGQIRKLLDSSIEEWMVYLHPSQRAIANADFNGPARVRGGPGTGKTVVALHRARVLARQRVHDDDKVLLTTFLSSLPKVWTALIGLLDDKALARLEIRNTDVLARDLVATDRSEPPRILDGRSRSKLVAPLVKRHALPKWLADNPLLILDEFDAFLAGREIDELEDYLALRRRGGGSAMGAAERERVFAAYSEYRERLRQDKVLDWAQLRLEALRLAEAGAGPRFNGVVVDEAQDLSAVAMRFLSALDESENHRHFLIVGDGQQSIYPGGYSLREIGIEIVGRSRVLTSNWRNTWSVWTAARAIVDGQEFDDLDEDVGLRPTGEEPEPLTVGEPTELHVLRSPGEELDLLAALVSERIEQGVDPGDLAVLVEVNRKGEDVMRALGEARIPTQALDRYEGQHANGVLVGTFNRAKGLEFKEVLIPGLAAAEWPSRWFVPPELGDDQRRDRLALQLRTLFVGMSRARDRLVLLAGGAPCEPVERADWALEVRTY